MNKFPYPHYFSNPFRDILINSKFIKSLRDLKFNKSNFWNIEHNSLPLIYDILNDIQNNDKIIMYQESPFVMISRSNISNKFIRPIISKIFCGYSHFDFIDFLIELTIYHRINLNFKSREFKFILFKLTDFYPNEKNIFDVLFRELI